MSTKRPSDSATARGELRPQNDVWSEFGALLPIVPDVPTDEAYCTQAHALLIENAAKARRDRARRRATGMAEFVLCAAVTVLYLRWAIATVLLMAT